MSKQSFEFFQMIGTTGYGDSNFIADLNSTANEESRPPVVFFQRQCVRALLSFSIDDGGFFKKYDLFVIAGSQVSVVRQNPDQQGLNARGKIVIPFAKLVYDFEILDTVAPVSREGVALRQCIRIANNVGRYLMLALGEDVFLEICAAYKSEFLGLEPEEHTQARFSEFARKLATSTEVTREAVQERAYGNFGKSMLALRVKVGLFMLSVIVRIVLVVGLFTWAISTRGFGIATIAGVLCVLLGASGILQSFRKQDTINDMIQSGRDPQGADKVLRKLRVIGAMLLVAGVFLLR